MPAGSHLRQEPTASSDRGRYRFTVTFGSLEQAGRAIFNRTPAKGRQLVLEVESDEARRLWTAAIGLMASRRLGFDGA